MKRINSGAKGDRGERQLCCILFNRFQRPFARVVGSGNRWSQVKTLTPAQKDCLVGDIATPPGFLWTIECKSGYEDRIDFNSFTKPNKTIDGFLDQVDRDAELSGKKPLLCYKRSRQEWLAFVPFSTLMVMDLKFAHCLFYREWVCVSLEALLSAPDSFYLAPQRSATTRDAASAPGVPGRGCGS